MGHEHLPAADQPAVTIAHGPGPQAGGVRARLGLGHRQAPRQLTGNERAQVPFLLFRSSAEQQRARAFRTGERVRGQRAARPLRSLAEQNGGSQRQVAAAPVGWIVAGVETEARRAPPDAGAHVSRNRLAGAAAGLARERLKLPADEGGEAVSDSDVLGAVKGRGQRRPSLAHSRPRPRRSSR